MKFGDSINTIKQQQLYRQVKVVDDGVLNFCSNDYLGLKNHPKVIQAFKSGAHAFGVGSGASHLASGHTKAHAQLEETLADYTGQEKALLFSTGYMANLGVFSALRDDLDWVLQDKLNHASLLDANQLCSLPLQRYLHNSPQSLKQKIAKQTSLAPRHASDTQHQQHTADPGGDSLGRSPHRGQGLVATDTVFSMDGDQANIEAINAITQQSNALFYQDDAHGFGLFTPNIPKDSIYMATLGKAAGTMGAFVAGNGDFIDFLVQKSRPYTYTTAMPPAICTATLKSLELIKQGEQQAQLFDNIAYFKTLANALHLPILESSSAIQPLMIGESAKALTLSDALLAKGFYIAAIRPPTVPKGTERLRITLSASHSKTQIKQLLMRIKHAL